MDSGGLRSKDLAQGSPQVTGPDDSVSGVSFEENMKIEFGTDVV